MRVRRTVFLQRARRWSSHKYKVLFAVFPFFASTGAHAANVLPTCQPADSPLVCRLKSVLTLLDTAAAVLGLLLVVAVLAAVGVYRRKSRKLTPDEITHDAP